MRHISLIASGTDVEFFRPPCTASFVLISLTGKSHIGDYTFRSIDLQAPICCARLPKAKPPRYRDRRNLTFMKHDIKEHVRVAR